MSYYTYTLVIKIAPTWGVSDIEKLVKDKLSHLSSFSPVVARMTHGEALTLVHVMEDSSSFGIALADWLAEIPHNPPYPKGSLLWYR